MKKMATLFCITLLLVGVLAGCSERNEQEASKKLYFLPMVDTGAYWSVIKAGAQDKADELGYELVTKTSPWSDSQKNEKQIGFVSEGIAEKAAAISVAPMDPDMLNPKAKEGMEADIPLITFDADVTESQNRLSYVGTDNYEAGKFLGAQAAAMLNENGVESGKLAMVLTVLTQTTMIDRKDGIMDGFNQEMGTRAEQFDWLEPIADNDQAATSKSQLEGQMVANEDLVAVFSLGSEGPSTGTMEAIKTQNRAEQVLHFGIDYTPTWENGIDQQLITGIIDQDAYRIGEQIVEAMVDAAQGKEIADNYAIEVKWIEATDLIEYGAEKQTLITE